MIAAIHGFSNKIKGSSHNVLGKLRLVGQMFPVSFCWIHFFAGYCSKRTKIKLLCLRMLWICLKSQSLQPPPQTRALQRNYQAPWETSRNSNMCSMVKFFFGLKLIFNLLIFFQCWMKFCLEMKNWSWEMRRKIWVTWKKLNLSGKLQVILTDLLWFNKWHAI